MKNISLYIAQRYNTHTLVISMVLIIIFSLLTGALIYITNSSIFIFRELLYPRQAITSGQNLLVYSLVGVTITGTASFVFLFFNRILSKHNRKSKLIIAFLTALISGILTLVLMNTNTESSDLLDFISMIFMTVGLLSLFFGLVNLILGNKKITGVGIITSIAVFAITIATTALFVILSVFTGLEKMNIDLFKNVNPDLRVSPLKGKTLSEIDELTQKLDANPDVLSYSKMIEEKVSIEFDGKQDIAYIRGIDTDYNHVVKIDTTVVHGDFFDFDNPYQLLASDGVARRLQMYIDHQNPARLRMPKPGTGLIKSEDEAFNTAVATPTGVFIINDQFDKYVFSPIELTQILLELPENSAYSLEIKLKPGVSDKKAKAILQKELGSEVNVQTRQDMDATFLKVMNIENLITYLIFTLVIVIASFNLAGAIVIIIIDKTKQIHTLRSFGMQLSHIKSIFFQTGLLITLFSIFFGLLLGSLLGILQNTYHLVMATLFVPFPFEFTLGNYLVVILTVLLIGSIVSWLVSRRIPTN